MLKIKEVFKKEKLSPEEEKEKLKNQILVYGGIFLIFVLFVIFAPSGEGLQDRVNKYSLNNINSLFESITDNYNFVLSKSTKTDDYTLNYGRDGNMIMLEGSVLDETGYMIYNNKNYVLKNSNILEVDKIGYIEPMEEYHYDFNLLKDFLNKCNLSYESMSKYSCKLKVSDYIETYNRINNTSYVVEVDDDINIDIVFYNDVVDKITFDYSLIDKIITGKESEFSIYSLEFQEINKNDYSTYSEYMNNNIVKNNN